MGVKEVATVKSVSGDPFWLTSAGDVARCNQIIRSVMFGIVMIVSVSLCYGLDLSSHSLDLISLWGFGMFLDALACSGMLWDALGCSGMLWDALHGDRWQLNGQFLMKLSVI